MGSRLLAVQRLLLFLGLTLLSMPVQAVAVFFKLPLQKSFPLWYHRQLSRIVGLRVVRRGVVSREHPTLFVVNHTSYWDIVVMGALAPVSFVAKKEVASWPFFSWLAKLQRSVFVERHRRASGESRDDMLNRLEAGDDLVLFPEGTSGDGNRVLPFKSALFSVAEYKPHDRPVVVQPVTVAYTELDGVPLGRYLRPFFTWYGDMDLGSHLWEGVGMGRLTAVAVFHPPVSIEEFGSRKALAQHCEKAVRQGLDGALQGRRNLVSRHPDLLASVEPKTDQIFDVASEGFSAEKP